MVGHRLDAVLDPARERRCESGEAEHDGDPDVAERPPAEADGEREQRARKCW